MRINAFRFSSFLASGQTEHSVRSCACDALTRASMHFVLTTAAKLSGTSQINRFKCHHVKISSHKWPSYNSFIDTLIIWRSWSGIYQDRRAAIITVVKFFLYEFRLNTKTACHQKLIPRRTFAKHFVRSAVTIYICHVNYSQGDPRSSTKAFWPKCQHMNYDAVILCLKEVLKKCPMNFSCTISCLQN